MMPRPVRSVAFHAEDDLKPPLNPHVLIVACRVVEPDRWCRRCGCEGAARDGDEPLGWRPTTLLVSCDLVRGAGLW